MARRRRTYRRYSRRQPGNSGCLLLILGGIGVVFGTGAIAALQEFFSHPLYAAVAILILGGVSVSGVWLAIRWRRARAAEAERRRAAYLAHISTLNGLLSLTPSQFELAIRDLMHFWGYPTVQHTGRSGDLAADLICYDAAGFKTVVQCKRYSPGNLISSPEIQKFIGMIYAHHQAHQGIFVTTSGFTQPALALAQEHHIRAIDGNELVGHIQHWKAAVLQAQQSAQMASNSSFGMS